MLKVFRNLLSLEAVYFKYIIVISTIDTKNHNASIVSFSPSRICEVNCRHNIKSLSLEKPVVVSVGEEVRIVVLEEISLDGGGVNIVRIVIVLGAEMHLIKVL